MMHEENESDVLDIIKKLMEELSEKMEYSKDDLSERLGRNKPAAVEIEVTKGPHMMAMKPDMMGKPDMEDMDKDEDEEYEEMPGLDDEDDEAGMLKKRLMNLRKA